MSHWAEIDPNDHIVKRVLVWDDSNGENLAHQWLVDNLGGTWIQCSYNHNIRKQYPGPGYWYDQINNVFIAPRPYPSWSLNNDFDWVPPVPYPGSSNDPSIYIWNERDLDWIKLT